MIQPTPDTPKPQSSTAAQEQPGPAEAHRDAPAQQAHGALRLLVEHSRTAMAIATRDGRITYFNPAVASRLDARLMKASTVEEFIRLATEDKEARSRALHFWQSEVLANNEANVHPEIFKGPVNTAHGTVWITFHFLVLREKIYVILVDAADGDATLGLELAYGPIREMEDKCRALYGSTAEAFAILELDGNIRQTNHAFESLMGYTAHELSTINCIDLVSPERHALISRILEEQVLARGYSELFQNECNHKDGTLLQVEMLLALIRDKAGNPESVCAFIRNTSHHPGSNQILHSTRNLLEERVALRTKELFDSEVRFRQVTEVSLEGIAVTENGIYLDANKQLASMLGWTVAEMIGRPVTDFLADISHEQVLRNIATNYSGSYECLMRRRDGTTFYIEARGRTEEWHGRSVRVAMLRALSERKRIEQELAAQRSALLLAHQRNVRSEIFAGIVHQIGQPVSIIGNDLAAAKILHERGDLDQPAIGNLINVLEEQLERIRSLSLNFRSLIHAGAQDHAPVNVNELIRNALRHLSHTPEFPGIRFETSLQNPLPPIYANALQLEHALLNIIQNAIEATSQNTTREQLISISSQISSTGNLDIQITDSGPGLDPAVIHQIFDPFFTTKEDGTGIGLALSRRVIMNHGGSLRAATSPNNEGAIFSISLPALEPQS